MTDLTEEQIDALHEAGRYAAQNSWGPAGICGPLNPHPEGSSEAEIWDYAFRNEFARRAR